MHWQLCCGKSVFQSALELHKEVITNKIFCIWIAMKQRFLQDWVKALSSYLDLPFGVCQSLSISTAHHHHVLSTNIPDKQTVMIWMTPYEKRRSCIKSKLQGSLYREMSSHWSRSHFSYGEQKLNSQRSIPTLLLNRRKFSNSIS